MFALPGIIALLVFLYIRPQEVSDALLAIPFLHLFLALAMFGYAVDVRLRLSRPRLAPQLGLVLAFALWSTITVVVSAPDRAAGQLITIAIPVVATLVIGHAIQTFRALHVVVGTLLAVCLMLTFVGLHQGQADRGCVMVDPEGVGDYRAGAADGRPCDKLEICYGLGAEPGKEYVCERVGLLGTSSVGGRVRYRGILQDPNELALAIGTVLPFAFAFALVAPRGRRLGRGALAVLAFAAIAVCIKLTQSRGGQLVFLAAVGIYVLERYRWKGMVVGIALALPVLMLGGRGGSGASQSTMERLEAWQTGIEMFRNSPVFGVGMGQFLEHHYLNAHSAFVLALAETGALGLFLWTSVLYLSCKIAVAGYFRFRRDPDAWIAREWSLAIGAAMAGMIAGIFFLSFSYHAVFWIFVGLTGALYHCCATHDPNFRVRFGVLDAIAVALFDVALIGAMMVYLRLNPPG